jgi:hypothetical protein
VVDYTEKASLLLVDKSSGNVNKINRALNSLYKTATRTQQALNKLGSGNAANRINATAKAVNALARAANKLPKNISIGVKLRGNSAADLRSMARAMAQYKSASKNINTLIGAGGKASNFQNLDVLTQKLVRVARAANLAAIALGKAKANIPGRGGFQPPGMPPGGGRNGNYMFPRNIGLEIQPLKSFWRSAVVSLGHTIFNSIRDAFAEGVKGFDVAENKMAQQRLNNSQRQQFEQAAFSGSQRFPAWRADQRLDFYSEVATNFRDPTDALKFDKQLERAIAVSMQQGQSAEQAVEGLATMFRGLGQAGYLQDSEGKFNQDVLKYLDAYTAAKVSEGAQINWNDAFQFLKYARTAGMSITPQEFFNQMLAAADTGASTTGVQLNQAIKNFAGETTKKAIQAQEEGGLRDKGEMVLSGQVGNRKQYTYEAGGIKDEDLLRENPNAWIMKNIMGKGGFLEKQGLDPLRATTAQIISALDPLAGNRNVDDWLAKGVLQMQERMIKGQKYYQNPLSDTELQNISQQSSWVQLQETTNQVTELFGLLGNKLEKTFIPVIDGIGNAAQWLTGIINTRSKDDMTGYALAAGGTALTGVAGVAAWKGTSALLTGFGLPAAASQLQVAATQLQAAAASLQGGAAADAAGDIGKSKKNSWSSWLLAAGAWGTAAAGMFIPSSSRQPQSDAERNQQQKFNYEQASKHFADEYNSKVQDQQADQALLQDMLQKIATLQGNIDLAKSKGNEAFAMVAQNQLMNLQTQAGMLQQQMQDRSAEIMSSFDRASETIRTASNEFGANVADDFMGIASNFGAAAGAAMRQAFGSIAFTVPPTLQTAPANTGTNTNLQNGG